jgi:hypothetical protein
MQHGSAHACYFKHRRHIIAKVYISMVFIYEITSSSRRRCYIGH